MIWLWLAVPLALAAVYFTHAAFKYTRMISNIFLSLVYRPEFHFSGSAVGEKITILDSSDREIETLWMEKKGSRKTVIFCHESGATKESWEKYAYFLPALGFSVLSVDFGVPEAAGQNNFSQWPTFEDVDRLLTVIRWAKKAFDPRMELFLFGISNGADIAFAASFLNPSVKAVVADGLFSMKEIFRDYIRKWAPIVVKPNLFGQKYPAWVVHVFTELGFWRSQRESKKKFVDVEALLKKNHVPLLMIHGAQDDYVPATHQNYLEKIHKRNVLFERFLVPGAGHNEAVTKNGEVYERKITDFLQKF